MWAQQHTLQFNLTVLMNWRYWVRKLSLDDDGLISVNSMRSFLLILLCFYKNILSFWLTCASSIVYLLMDLSSDDVSVCLSVTPFSEFHLIKSWLKWWQIWHTLFIILMSHLRLADVLKASHSSHDLQTHSALPQAWRSWTYSTHNRNQTPQHLLHTCLTQRLAD